SPDGAPSPYPDASTPASSPTRPPPPPAICSTTSPPPNGKPSTPSRPTSTPWPVSTWTTADPHGPTPAPTPPSFSPRHCGVPLSSSATTYPPTSNAAPHGAAATSRARSPQVAESLVLGSSAAPRDGCARRWRAVLTGASRRH